MAPPVLTVYSEGKRLGHEVAVLSLEVRREIDRVPEARLVLADGSVAARDFALSSAAHFAPGNKVRVELRAGDDPDVPLFEGLVVRHAALRGPSGAELRVELRDPAFKLTRRRRSAVYREQTDDAVFRKLVDDAGLAVGALDPTSATHAELVQYYASDWDFLVSRADVNGQVVLVDGGEVSVRALTSDGPAPVKLRHGFDPIHELELELDAGGQWAGIQGVAWDVAQQAASAPIEAADFSVASGDLDVAAVASALGGDSYTLLLPGSLAPAELQPWADARLARSRLALLRGRLVVDGRADIKPLDFVELEGVGKRFDGKRLVSAVVQRVDHGRWRTELHIGVSPEWFARTPDIADIPAGGLLPPVGGGLHIGLVEATEDPDGAQRIKVRLPAIDHDDPAVFARMAHPDAGKDHGFVWWPQVGDEVVVGFLAGDPRQPVILGALFSSANTPPKPAGDPTSDNFHRSLVSPAGTTIDFDDEKKILTLKTPGDSTVVLDDDAASITLSDKHGNTITMDSKGITLKSAGDLKIEADGKVAIKGSAVDIQ